MSSQPCEQTFRKLRSTTTSHCGVVSFSILDLQNHFRRIDLLSSTFLKLGNEFSFPRHHKAFKVSDVTPYIPTTLPENYEIENSVQVALDRAIKRAYNFDLIKKNRSSVPEPNLRVISPTEVDMNTMDDVYLDEDSNENLDENDLNGADDNQELNSDTDYIQEKDNELDQEEELNDVIEDLLFHLVLWVSKLSTM